MGSKKVKDWRYSGVKKKTYDPALLDAIRLANADFRARKEARRILAVDKEVAKIEAENIEAMTNEFTDWDYGCAVLVLFRNYGFDAVKCAEFLDKLQTLNGKFVDDGMHSNDIWDVVRDEVGLDVTKDW